MNHAAHTTTSAPAAGEAPAAAQRELGLGALPAPLANERVRPPRGGWADDPLRPLTVAQERFCQHLMAGLCATAAYQAAFPKSNERAAGVNACFLRRKPNVLRRLKELSAEDEARCLMRRSRRLERLREIAESADANTRDVIAAIKTINDMAGDGGPKNPEPDAAQAGLLALLRQIRAGRA